MKEILEANVLVGDDNLDDEVLFGAAGDLMSDLLKNPREGAILLTGLPKVRSGLLRIATRISCLSRVVCEAHQKCRLLFPSLTPIATPVDHLHLLWRLLDSLGK